MATIRWFPCLALVSACTASRIDLPVLDAGTSDVRSSVDAGTSSTDVPTAIDSAMSTDQGMDVSPTPVDVPPTPVDVPPTPVDVPPTPVDVGVDAGAVALPSDLRDWLFQDVCAQPDGTLLADDPWDGCPSGSVRRDLAIGDALPYHRHDQPGAGAPQGYQRHDSFPRSGAGNRGLSTFDFAPFGEFNPDHDGYDAVEFDGDYASIIGTRDPSGLAQTFFGGCRLDDAWLLMPTRSFLPGGNTVARLRLVAWERMGQPFPGTCPSGTDAALTRWALRPVDFGGIGSVPVKRMDALVVDHYGGERAETADHIERFYFTPAYGLTRWERWQNNGGTPRAEGCRGDTAEGTFRRVDCRDWTNIVPDPTRYPPGAWPSPYVDGNRVRNHDFGGGAFTSWERLGTSTSGSMTNVLILEEGGDHHLATNCGGTCSAGQSIFQDVPRDGLSGSMRFGLRARTDSGTGTLDVVVFERDERAALVARHSISLSPSASWERATSAAFEVAAATTQFRVQLYLNSAHTFRVDDVWLAREQR